MLHPGSKGWINKYFDLVEKEHFQLVVERPTSIGIEHFLHLTFGRTGIVFGYPSRLLFANSLNSANTFSAPFWPQDPRGCPGSL